MELYHQRLVLGTDRPDCQGSSIAELPFADELLRIRTNYKPWHRRECGDNLRRRSNRFVGWINAGSLRHGVGYHEHRMGNEYLAGGCSLPRDWFDAGLH